jgi:hypothetical protein
MSEFDTMMPALSTMVCASAKSESAAALSASQISGRKRKVNFELKNTAVNANYLVVFIMFIEYQHQNINIYVYKTIHYVISQASICCNPTSST